MSEEVTVMLWHSASYHGETFTDEYDTPGQFPDADTEIQLEDGEAYLLVDDPYYHQYHGVHVEESLFDGESVTVYIYTNDSVRGCGYGAGERVSHIDTAYWDGPIERGLVFDGREDEPFWCEWWGRTLIHVEVNE